MYEIMNGTNQGKYIVSPSTVGLYISGETEEGKKKGWLIDTGNDKDAGKKILRSLEGAGIELQGIFLTHHHADHAGGCRMLQNRRGVPAWSKGMEACIAEKPVMETMLLYGGDPPKELRHKFLMAQACGCGDIAKHPEALPGGLEIIDLSGHSPEMTGFRTGDGCIYLADCVADEAMLEKHKMWVVYNVEDYLRTLRRVREMKAEIFIPSHTKPTEDIKGLADLNIEAAQECADMIERLIREPVCGDELIRAVFEEIKMDFSIPQYVLIGSTVRAYLTYLEKNGRAVQETEDGLAVWQAKK